MSNISKNLNKIIKKGWKNLRYAKVLHEPDDKSWSVRHSGEGDPKLYSEWKQHLFKIRFCEERSSQGHEDEYYECTQYIVCYDAVPGGEDSVTGTYENGCFFCIGAKYNAELGSSVSIPIQEIYDIEHIWNWIEDDNDKLAVKKAVLKNWKNGCNIWGDVRCEVGMMCFGCIKPRICILLDDNGKPVTSTIDTYKGEVTEEIGWCEKCSRCKRCREEGRKPPNKVTHRIYWTVGCPDSALGEVVLCSDVCDDHHSVEQDCPCSQRARNLRSNKYTYL